MRRSIFSKQKVVSAAGKVRLIISVGLNKVTEQLILNFLIWKTNLNFVQTQIWFWSGPDKIYLGTIPWDFGSLECALLSFWIFQLGGNFIRGIDLAYQNLTKTTILCFQNWITGWLTAVSVETQPFYWIFEKINQPLTFLEST